MKSVVPLGYPSRDFGFRSAERLHWYGFKHRDPVREANQIDIPGVLVPPDGKRKPYPIVILIPGSTGYTATHTPYIRALNQQGIGVYLFDGFCARGFHSVVGRQASFSTYATINDAFRALAELAKLPEVDKDNVGLMGTSRGGTATVLATDQAVQSQLSSQSLRFKAGVGVYPGCVDHLENKTPSSMKLLMQLGKKDDYAPAEQCRQVASQMKNKGFSVDISEYDAHHSWDSGLARFRIKNETGFGRCSFQIADTGLATEQATKTPIRSVDQVYEVLSKCGTPGGVTIEGDSALAERSRHELVEFFKRHLVRTAPSPKPPPPFALQ